MALKDNNIFQEVIKMTKKYSTKKALISSLLSLVLCFSSLLGMTFAWFTDSVTSANNIIATGNLDIELYHADNGTDGADERVESTTVLFDDVDSDLWEPGAMAWEKFTVRNEGSLDLRYEFTLNARNATVVDGISFASLLQVAIVDSDFVYTRKNVESINDWQPLTTFTMYGSLSDGEESSFGIIIWWQPGATDNLFNMNNGRQGETASVDVGVILNATQAMGETDSFGPDYDAGATFPKRQINVTEQQSVADVIDEGGVLTEEISVGRQQSEAQATVPAGVQLADGATELTLTVNTIKQSEANIEINEKEEDALSVNVHIDGIAEDNTVPMLITLKGLVRPGLNDNNIKLYHVENGVTVEMTAVGQRGSLAEHNQFYYDAVSGDVVLSMASFSEVALIAHQVTHWDGTSATEFAGGSGSEEDPYLIANASQLAYFRDQVDQGRTFEGEFIRLANNIFLNHEAEFNNLFDPIGWGYSYAGHNGGEEGRVFKGTFDGNYYSIHGLWQNGWSLEEKTGTDYTYTNCGGGLFASVENATIKNLGMIDAIITFECVEIGIVVGLAQGNCTFENIFVYDSKIANYQRSTGGIVGEISPSRDANGVASACTFTFKDIVLDTSVVVGSLWGDFDTPVGGVIGARWDDDNASAVTMENVKVACELDVYNDVTSTYQWYAYRRAGMLIGNTDTPPADGKNSKVATADFLTCTDVYVYYTNWAKYNYCQFSNHNSSWPWVRVQAGENCSAFSNPRYGVPNDVNGNKVVDLNHQHQEGDQCNVQIYFNQLYGGGQGVYGQSEHPGVSTDVKYLITFMHDDHVASIRFITDNSAEHTVVFPDTTLLPHLDRSKRYEWLNRNGATVTDNATIPAGNMRDIFYYLTESDKYFAHFVDKDGFYVAQLEFDPKTGMFLDSAEEPQVPVVPGYNGIWAPYTLLGAEHDVIVNAVYSKSDSAEVLTTAEELFDLLGRGYHLSMSRDLEGDFGSANETTFCTVVSNPDEGKDYTARVDLNSFTLLYEGNASGNKDWTLFHILGAEGDRPASKLTVGDGIAGFGFLYFDLSRLNSNASPCIFDLEEGATLVLERGVVIEFRYPADNGNTIQLFRGVSDYTDTAKYPGLQIEQSQGLYRITVTARTVLVGDGTDAT